MSLTVMVTQNFPASSLVGVKSVDARADTKEVRPPGAEEAAADITRDIKAFAAAIRNQVFDHGRPLHLEHVAALRGQVRGEAQHLVGIARLLLEHNLVGRDPLFDEALAQLAK